MKNKKSEPKDIKRAILTVLALSNGALTSKDILEGVKKIYPLTSADKRIYRGNVSFFDNMFHGTFSSRAFEQDKEGRTLILFTPYKKRSYLLTLTSEGYHHLKKMK